MLAGGLLPLQERFSCRDVRVVLRGESVEHVDEVEKLLGYERSNGTARSTDFEGELPKSAERPFAEPLLTEKLIAISHVDRAAEEGVTRAKLEEMREGIERDIGKFRTLLKGGPDRCCVSSSPAAVVCA